ncbi:MAG: tautomerase family protein [Acinetobacter sp.]|nr:MAG: tautomerase family protein [Acinetobacter sp.]
MPSVMIEVRREYTAEQEIAIIDAVQSALVKHFQIPAKDKHIRFFAHLPHRFACPPDQEQSEFYTQISIDAFAGRSLEAKRNLYQGIVSNLALLGISPNYVSILIREIPLENWGIRGGQAACDIDLGFKVNV